MTIFSWLKTLPLSPAQQLFYAALVFSSLCALIALTMIAYTISDLNDLQATYEKTKKLLLYSKKEHASNAKVWEQYKGANPFYLHEKMEGLPLLQEKQLAILEALDTLSLEQQEHITQDLDALDTQHNRLSFTEMGIKKSALLQETTEALTYPVKVDLQDIKMILAHVEGATLPPFSPSQNRPHMLILEFSLQKDFLPVLGEHFSLDMKLLQRQYLWADFLFFSSYFPSLPAPTLLPSKVSQ